MIGPELTDQIFEAMQWDQPIGRLLDTAANRHCTSLRIPAMREPRVWTAAEDHSEVSFDTIKLSRVRLAFPVDRLMLQGRRGNYLRHREKIAWSVEPEDVANLHGSSIFEPLVPPSPESYERVHRMLDRNHERDRFLGFENVRRAAAARAIHETEDPIERARLKARFFAELYSGGTEPIQSQEHREAQPLTLETLRRACGLEEDSYQRALFYERDFAEMERRALAHINSEELRQRELRDSRTGCISGYAAVWDHDDVFLQGDVYDHDPWPDRPRRQSAELRPLEDFLEDCDEMIAESRREWLGDVEQLPDARISQPQLCEEEYRYDHSDEDRPAPLAPPADFLPARR